MKRSAFLLLLFASFALRALAGTDCWTYVPGSPRGTISWTDSSGFENIVKGIELDGAGVKIKANQNRNSPTIKNLDLSLPVRDESGADLTWSPDVLKGDDGNNVIGYSTYLTNIVLPSSCTSVGSYCFKQDTALVRVRLNDGLKTIKLEAFAGCSALATVENFFPDSLETLGNNAFNGCSVLGGDAVAAGLKSIGSRVFRTCSALHSFDFGNSSVETIQEYAFYQNKSLESVVFPVSLTNLADGVFESCTSLRNVTPLLPPKLAKLGSDSHPPFLNCPIEGHMVSPHTLERIGPSAFRTGMFETFTAPRKGLKSIGQYAFSYNTAITNIVLSTDLEALAQEWLYKTGTSGVEQHVWFRNLPVTLPGNLWGSTTAQNIMIHLPLSKEKEWREWVASSPDGHTFTFNNQTAVLPEKPNDIGTWKSGYTQNVTWWKDLDAPTMVLIK